MIALTGRLHAAPPARRFLASVALLALATLPLAAPPAQGADARTALEQVGGAMVSSDEYINRNLSQSATLPFVSTPTPTPTPSGGSLNLPREAWWGGAAYYSKFSKAAAAGWTDPSFFPISVFLGRPSHAAALKAAGVNTYMGAEHDGSTISSITDTGMYVLAQSEEWTSADVGNDARVVGWHISDECEMGYSGCLDTNDEYGRLAVQESYAATTRAKNDGRFVQANFGNGVLGTWWAPDTMDDHLNLVDVSSVDKYAYTSPHVDSLLTDTPSFPSAKNPASAGAYGWLQDRMEAFATPAASKPNWVFVETARPYLTEADARTITGEQIEGAVWNAIIHGAAGIAYFQHNNDTSCGSYSILECGTALTTKITAINAQVTRMAPVINTQPYQWTFGTGLDTSLRTQGGSAYILAMTDGGTGTRTLTLPPGITATTVQVIDENRTLTITNGTFTDTFPTEATHHIYEINLG